MSRGGRKRKPGIRRQPDGRANKNAAQHREDARETVLKGRQRVFGLSEGDSARIEATDCVGRMCLSKSITPRQLEAWRMYEAAIDEYAATYLATSIRLGSSANWDRAGGHDSSDGLDPGYVAKCLRALRVHDETAVIIKASHPYAPSTIGGMLLGKDWDGWAHVMRPALEALADYWNLPKVPEDDVKGG